MHAHWLIVCTFLGTAINYLPFVECNLICWSLSANHIYIYIYINRKTTADLPQKTLQVDWIEISVTLTALQNLEFAMPNYTLYYFNGRGRAEICRMLMAAAGVQYTDKRFEFNEWDKYRNGKLSYVFCKFVDIFCWLSVFVNDIFKSQG